MTTPETIPVIRILGVRVNPISMAKAIEITEGWINLREKCRYIVATGMHGIMEAHKSADFKWVLESASLFVADGISVAWLARRKGFPLKTRVSGPDLMWEFLKVSQDKGYRNYFYGDTDEILEALTTKLKLELPGLQIAGAHSPPFRSLTEKEDAEEVDQINRSKPDIVWVGLGLPKQERWMFDHQDRLDAPVLVGVGAAFKFISGKATRAPSWIGDNGFEWLWRLITEPRRIWRRVLLDGPRFIWRVILELTGLKKYD